MLAAAVLTAPVVALTAVPAWQFRHWQWIALALAAPVVGWAVRCRPPGPSGVLAVAGPLAALGWSVYLLLVGGAGVPGAVWSLTGGAPLAAAAGLAAIALLTRERDGAAGRALAVVVVGAAVAALGFWLGRGAGPVVAVAAAVAVLVAGSPTALLLAPPRIRRMDTVVVPEELLTTGEREIRAVHGYGAEDDVRRFAAALHSTTDGALSRAVVAAATGPLPGVSDLDGAPDTGLRGITSELHADRVVAHAVLVGPPSWLAEHGVAVPDEIGPDEVRPDEVGPDEVGPDEVGPDEVGPGVLAVAWDGVARGWLDVAATPRPGVAEVTAALRRRGVTVLPAPAPAPAPNGSKGALLQCPDLAAVARAVRRQHRRVRLHRMCLVVAQATAVGGAAAALPGVLNPATAVAVPLATAVLVAAGRAATTRSGLPPSRMRLRP